MTPPWWGIGVVLVVGVAVIWAGWWLDRRRHRAASAGFLTEDDLGAQPWPDALPDAEVTALLAARPDAARWPAGLADRVFLTHPARGVAAVRRPLVLVTDGELAEVHPVLALLQYARDQDRPLVLVAPGFSADLLGTLHANTRTGRVITVPVVLSDPDRIAEVATASRGRVVPAATVQAGWFPDQIWGRAAWWIAGDDDSWALPEKA